jgi:hypothetical protein
VLVFKTSTKAAHLLTQYNKHSKTKTKQQSKKKPQHKQQKQAKNKQIQQTSKQKKKSKSDRATPIQHELPNKCVGHSHFTLN